jgi:formylglycine-generating enzyme required for sulfatase activity
VGSFAWYEDNADHRIQPVALLLPNDFGLFDVYGNASELCQDEYNSKDAAADPNFTSDGNPYRARRGGNVTSKWYDLRSASRSSAYQESMLPHWSFRVCRTLPGAD